MEIQKTVHYNWTRTLDSMEVGESFPFPVSEIREYSLRSIVSRMKKQGYDFSVLRKGDIIEVACIKRPENKEGER